MKRGTLRFVVFLLPAMLPITTASQQGSAKLTPSVPGDSSGRTKSPNASTLSQSVNGDSETRKLADRAEVLPPELEADALIRIVALKSRPQSAKQKKLLLSDAFDAAMHAKYEAPVVGLTTANTDSDVGAVSEALDLGLDRLSLQSRVVSSMAPIDATAAEDRLRQIVMPMAQSLSCDDETRNVLTPFYDAAGNVLKAQELPDRRRKLAEWLLGTLLTPTQIESVLRLLVASPLPATDKGRLISELAARMGDMKMNDPRTASATLNFGLNQAVFDALKSEKETGDQTLLLSAYRQLIVNNLGSVCSDDKEFIERVKSLLHFLDERAQTLGLPAKSDAALDINPEVIPANGEAYLWWKKNGSKELFEGYERLSDPKERSQPEWSAKLGIFLDQFRAWQADNHEPQAVAFGETCEVYRAVIDITPAGETRNHIVKESLEYLQSSPMEFDDPPQWYRQVHILMHPARAEAKAIDIAKFVDPNSPLGVISALDPILK
jgi:hypothetical protein